MPNKAEMAKGETDTYTAPIATVEQYPPLVRGHLNPVTLTHFAQFTLDQRKKEFPYTGLIAEHITACEPCKRLYLDILDMVHEFNPIKKADPIQPRRDKLVN